MILTADIFEAQAAMQIERFALSDGRYCVIESAADYKSKKIPAEVAEIIAARNAPPAPVVPESVSMRQARLALLGTPVGDSNALALVNSSIASLPGVEGEAARIEWEFATDVRRDAPLVAAMAAALGLSAEQLDQLFVAASSL